LGERIAISKKKIWLLLIVVIAVVLIVLYSKRQIAFIDVTELNTATIESAQTSYPEGMNWHNLTADELEQLSVLLNSLEVRKKLIPNVQAFNADSYIVIYAKEPETTFSIKFDYDRNIIGLIEGQKTMEQYIVERDSKLFLFVQNLINNNVKKL